MKKVFISLSIIISVLVMFTSFPVSSFALDYDVKAPVVSSLTISKHLVSPGDTITVTCAATDDSEISTDPDAEYKTFLYLNNGKNYTDVFYFTKTENDVYTATITIPETYVNGYYFLSYFVISDIYGNEYSTYSYSDFSDIYFEVVDASADTNAPEVSSIEIDKQEVGPGDRVTVSLSVIDENDLNTDFDSSYLYFSNGNYESTPFIFSKTDTGNYTAAITIPDTFVDGRYQFSYLVLTDIVGNVFFTDDASLYPHLYFDVSGASSDREAPEVNSLTIDKHDVMTGDTVTITCSVDDESAINEESLGFYLFLTNGTFHSELFEFHKTEGNTYQAVLPITDAYYDGTYSLDYFVVSDVIGNKFISYGSTDYPEIFIKVSGNPASENYRKPGWFNADEIWYYNDTDGNLFKGWLYLGNYWYYLNSKGEMVTGWLKYGDYWYYMRPSSGAMHIGWVYAEDAWYYLNDEGRMLTGWQKYRDKWYYLDTVTGKMVTGWVLSKGAWYYMDADGIMQTGWVQADGDWYYLNSGGKMLTGWQKYRDKWYYLDTVTGKMATGWVLSKGTWYYMNSNGVMQTGWVQADGDWYYLNSGGKMLTGWQKLGGYWYFLKPNGKMASGEWYNGYWFNKNGTWTYKPKGQWKKNSIGWWFGDTSGWYAKDQTSIINNVVYMFDSDGYLIEDNEG